MIRKVVEMSLFFGLVTWSCSVSAVDTVSFPVDQMPPAFLYMEAANRNADIIIRDPDPQYLKLKELLFKERSGWRYLDPVPAYADWDFGYAVDSSNMYIRCKDNWVSAKISVDQNYPSYREYADKFGLYGLKHSPLGSADINEFSAKEVAKDFSYVTPNKALWKDLESVGTRYLQSRTNDQKKHGMLMLQKNISCADILPVRNNLSNGMDVR